MFLKFRTSSYTTERTMFVMHNLVHNTITNTHCFYLASSFSLRRITKRGLFLYLSVLAYSSRKGNSFLVSCPCLIDGGNHSLYLGFLAVLQAKKSKFFSLLSCNVCWPVISKSPSYETFQPKIVFMARFCKFSNLSLKSLLRRQW